jgi:Sec-independent protein secretion pathway component TatC
MDIGKSFTFVFEDDEWITKLLLAAAILLLGIIFSWLLLIPLILAFALLYGYGVAITRQVMQGNLAKLPAWDNWGDLITDGLKVIVIGIVYALPIIILSICLGIPAGALAENSQNLSSLFSVLLSCLSLLWAIVMSVTLPAAVAFWVAADDLSAAFRFGEVLSFVRDNLATYLITFLMSWVANFIGQLGSIVCGIGWLVTVPYAWMVTGHLYGQAYVEASGQTPQPAIEEEAAA